MKSFDGREQINDKQGETINFLLISTCWIVGNISVWTSQKKAMLKLFNIRQQTFVQQIFH